MEAFHQPPMKLVEICNSCKPNLVTDMSLPIIINSESTQVKDAWKIVMILANRLKNLESLYASKSYNLISDTQDGNSLS